jgi:xanthine/uracil permease
MAAETATAPPPAPVSPDNGIEVGVNERTGLLTTIGLGFQHILGLAGLLLFPALVGKSFGLPPHQVAYLYGITFITSGVVVILQAVGLLRLPVVQAPFAGIFAALLVLGHQVGLGTAFGSLLIASLIWTVLSVPLKRWSVVARLSQRIGHPIVSGVILLIISAQLATIVLPSYFGTRTRPAPSRGSTCCARSSRSPWS